jgi:heme-degrading monooxygenase HmoA
MAHISPTPDPPYVAVIFTAVQSDDTDGYDHMAGRMETLAARQPGFLGIESAGSIEEITVSYWVDDNAARAWKRVAEHAEAQRLGRERWYRSYRVRVATVERDYGSAFEA